MTWTLNSNRIYVQKISGGVKQIIAKLQPLEGGTVYQYFGYETNTIKLTAKVVGATVLAALKALTTTGSSYDLTSPEGSLGNFFVSSVSEDRDKEVWQSIDLTGGLTCLSPVYTVDIELLQVT